MSKINQVAAALATVWKKPGLTQAAATLAAILSTFAFTLNVHHKYGKAKTQGIQAAMKGTYDSITGEDVNRIECTTKLSEKNTSAMKREIARSKKEIRKVKHVVNKAATDISRLPEQMRTIVQEEIHSARKKEKEALKSQKQVAGVTANPTHLEIARSKKEIRKVKHVVNKVATDISKLPEQMRTIVQEEIRLARKKEKESLKSEKEVIGVAANSTHLPMVQEEVQLKTILKSIVHSTTVHDSPKFDVREVREGKDGGLLIVVSSELALKQMVQRKISINEVLKSLKELVKTDSRVTIDKKCLCKGFWLSKR